MKRLEDILAGIKPLKVIGEVSCEITDIQFDSRKVKQGSVFVAVSGTQNDGHAFITIAVELGAKVVVCEKLPETPDNKICWVVTTNSAKALGIMASNYYNNPSKKLNLVGITGTNGKTTTVTLLYELFRTLGFKCGLISTVIYRVEDKSYEATHTTPDQLVINKLLNEMVETGCKYCFMEVSSHSLAQKRIAGLQFAGAIFSNITHDHLDYHVTFANYIKAKKSFFDQLGSAAFAIINIDDKNGRIMVQNTKARVITYSLHSAADYNTKIIESHFEGMHLKLDGAEFWTPLIGEFNAYNILAVYSTARMLGQDKQEILKLLSSIHEVPGRFETIRSKNGITGIVDYAHSPDALENVLNAIIRIRSGNEQLITVVGAGGNRDKTKRPKMARICAEKSDKVIITSDNPRFEEPEDIIHDMLAGIDDKQKSKTITIIDRREAIKAAIIMAKPGDIVLIAGKGHEPYQEVKGIRHHFDDKEELIKNFRFQISNSEL